MAVGLAKLSSLHPVAGIRLGSTSAGLRKPGRLDLVVIECMPGTQAAAVFTHNRFCAAPIVMARAHLAVHPPRALLINTGYANAGTGEPGERDAVACCQALAGQLHCLPEEILPFSTGVIGERLPADRLVAAMPSCVANLIETGWVDAAHGVMTTDTMAKGCSRQIKLGTQLITVTGIAKGSGMIRPDMATMLAFVATDAALSGNALAHCLNSAVRRSFNRITVDGDTSTNDAVVLLATGKAGNAPVTDCVDPAFDALSAVVTEVCSELAQMIVRDGEGATKFITIDVTHGASEADCLTVAYTIAHSLLVKTAFFAADPNWGRLLAAVGRAPIGKLDTQKVNIFLDEVCIVRAGAPAPDYTEARGRDVMRRSDIPVRIELGAGRDAARVWTCDLSHDYVRINAEYRT